MVNVIIFAIRSELMTSPRPTSRRRRLLATAIPVLLVAGVLPLLAPTCGNLSPGMKTFARNSLIIPMDLCYQSQADDVSASQGAYQAVGCPQGTAGEPGDVLKAYGLVYQLVRANIAVYWVINPSKAATADVDMSVQYNGGPPVLKYAWASGTISTTAPTAGSRIDYRGGPFVVDGSDFDRAVQVLNANRATFSVVNLHVSNVAFQGNVAKVMAGGWSAGGTVPPKLALLNIASDGIAGGAQNAESVIQSYLTRAGLDTASAGGTATGTHGQIYDTLTLEDFLPQGGGGPTSSRLFTNGYQILWVPHWAAPGSCSNVAACSRSQYTDAQVAQTLATIGAFVSAGRDLFAECASIGSFEGVNRDVSGSSTPAGFGNGVASTRFFTPAASFGFDINAWPTNGRGIVTLDTTALLGNFSSPLMQIGDYPFYAQYGAVDDYRPTSGTYLTNTVRFASAGSNQTYDVFTMMPPVAGGHGTIVYLAGHSYSKKDLVGMFEIGGSRLVLNTLFNLGAACVESGVACNTGLLGECAPGVMTCDSTGAPVCSPVHSPTAEVCDGKDNDCDGLVDDGLDVACYDGPADSLDPTTHQPRGICQAGVRSCVETSPGVWGMSACNGQVLPAATETCNGLDNDCDGRAGNVKGTATLLSQACYTGPSNTVDPISGFPRGICKAGQSTCSDGAWTACEVCPDTDPPPWRASPPPSGCQILPHTQICAESSLDAGYDMTCTGVINCTCTTDSTANCYDGPSGTDGVGICHHGSRTCSNGSWSACAGQVLPHARDCASSLDNDCNGTADASEPACQVTACPPETSELRICRVQGITRVPDAPTGAPQGVCRDGLRDCNPDGSVGECAGMILPSPEICDGQDNNCDGEVDENPDTLCNAGFTCVHGVCVKSSCGVENPCPVGYTCNSSGKCELGQCGGATCADGQVCQFGSCADPCDGVECATGAVCSSGFCTGGGCYLAGCGAGLSCIQGVCQPDPCASVACPLGTFCRAGDCVQSCVYVTCPSGQVCGADGFCEVDACQGVFCDPGQLCVDGTCVADECASKSCGPRQLCQNSVCQDNPCNTVNCPVGACSNGQCYPVTQRDTSQPTTSGSSSTGCGCGSGGDAGPLGAALLLLLLPLGRRGRRPFRPGGGARGALLTLAALAMLGGAACKGGDKSETDYSSCTETCGESRCIDLNYDSAHCGHCSTVCESGQICRDGVCGPSNAVAPYVRSVSPDKANHGLLTTIPVTLGGDRFQDGATVRAISGSGSRTFAATLADATHLTIQLDVSDVPVSQIALRVVNPDHVISNGVPFDVVSVAPHLTGVTPTSVTTGSVASLQVTGTGFASSSLCHMSGGSMGEVVLATTPITVDGVPALVCVFDATPASVQPGSYELWVVNDNLTQSNHLTFTVVSSVATLTALSPSSAEVSSVVDIDVTGTGFDSTSRAYFQWGTSTPVQATTVLLDATHLLIQGYLLPASPSTATVTVRNGSTTSTNSLPFAAVPRGGSVQVTSLTISPTPLYQGQNATLTFAGSGFPTVSRITVSAPTGATINATGVSGTTSSASGSVALSSLSPEPAGTYSAYVAFGDGSVSPSFQFQVLSNVAVLQSVTPAGAKQGTNPAVIAFKIGNVHGTPTITLAGGGTSLAGTSVALQPPGTDPTLWQANFDLRGRNTGTYTMSVQNPGAQPSNQISFTVLPGVPSITTISPSCVVQSSTVATVTITGQNFALPDAHGNALTRVMYSADNSTFYAIPATVTVNSATQITVQMDTRNAVANTTYYVQAWNPDDPISGAHQRSSSSSFRVAATSCP
jgi:hypothetical protein